MSSTHMSLPGTQQPQLPHRHRQSSSTIYGFLFGRNGIALRWSAQSSSPDTSANLPIQQFATSGSALPALDNMAVVAASPTPTSLQTEADHQDKLRNGRAPSPSSSTTSRVDSATFPQSPDLSDEIASLSTKLVDAINQQTVLDDSLQSARHDLDAARRRISELERQLKEHAGLIENGLLVSKEEVGRRETEWEEKLNSEIKTREKTEDERDAAREATQRVEKEKKKIEQELESLSVALFEEANTMVAAARKDHDAAEKKNEQLRNQLQDAEALLQSHQEQLQDLKVVVEKMSSEKGDDDSVVPASTTPSTPGLGPSDRMSRMFESTNSVPISPGDYSHADHPLRFSHLIQPVLRTDHHVFEEFKTLLQSGSKLRTPTTSRASSGSFGSLNVMSLGYGSNHSSLSPSPASPNCPQSSGTRSPRNSISVPALKETRLYKRLQTEDIDPTLRLDIAPGVSWMAKRGIMTSITMGSLVVEPLPPPVSKNYGPIYPCSLCGENRKGERYARRHRFRVSELEDSQHYPLCELCLGRLRATCDLVSFLRLVRDGHWRAETEDEINAAWEECVRLRERMFWQRIGGGVVPVMLPLKESPRTPSFPNSRRVRSEDLRSASKLATSADPFHEEQEGNGTKRVSIGKTTIYHNTGKSEPDLQSHPPSDDEQDLSPPAEQTPVQSRPAKHNTIKE